MLLLLLRLSLARACFSAQKSERHTQNAPGQRPAMQFLQSYSYSHSLSHSRRTVWPGQAADGLYNSKGARQAGNTSHKLLLAQRPNGRHLAKRWQKTKESSNRTESRNHGCIFRSSSSHLRIARPEVAAYVFFFFFSSLCSFLSFLMKSLAKLRGLEVDVRKSLRLNLRAGASAAAATSTSTPTAGRSSDSS